MASRTANEMRDSNTRVVNWILDGSRYSTRYNLVWCLVPSILVVQKYDAFRCPEMRCLLSPRNACPEMLLFRAPIQDPSLPSDGS